MKVPSRQPEVDEVANGLGAAYAHEEVLGLDVAMYEAQFVQMSHPRQHLSAQLQNRLKPHSHSTESTAALKYNCYEDKKWS